jgi:hypothetical protein
MLKFWKFLVCLQMYFLIENVFLWSIYLTFHLWFIELKVHSILNFSISLYCAASFLMFVRTFQYLKRGRTSNFGNVGNMILCAVMLCGVLIASRYAVILHLDGSRSFEVLKYYPTGLILAFSMSLLAWVSFALFGSIALVVLDWKTNSPKVCV